MPGWVALTEAPLSEHTPLLRSTPLKRGLGDYENFNSIVDPCHSLFRFFSRVAGHDKDAEAVGVAEGRRHVVPRLVPKFQFMHSGLFFYLFHPFDAFENACRGNKVAVGDSFMKLRL